MEIDINPNWIEWNWIGDWSDFATQWMKGIHWWISTYLDNQSPQNNEITAWILWSPSSSSSSSLREILGRGLERIWGILSEWKKLGAVCKIKNIYRVLIGPKRCSLRVRWVGNYKNIRNLKLPKWPTNYDINLWSIYLSTSYTCQP